MNFYLMLISRGSIGVFAKNACSPFVFYFSLLIFLLFLKHIKYGSLVIYN